MRVLWEWPYTQRTATTCIGNNGWLASASTHHSSSINCPYKFDLFSYAGQFLREPTSTCGDGIDGWILRATRVLSWEYSRTFTFSRAAICLGNHGWWPQFKTNQSMLEGSLFGQWLSRLQPSNNNLDIFCPYDISIIINTSDIYSHVIGTLPFQKYCAYWPNDLAEHGVVPLISNRLDTATVCEQRRGSGWHFQGWTCERHIWVKRREGTPQQNTKPPHEQNQSYYISRGVVILVRIIYRTQQTGVWRARSRTKLPRVEIRRRDRNRNKKRGGGVREESIV